MKKFIVLESGDKSHRVGLNLERTECGVIGIVNFHFAINGEYELLLTDEKGENFYAKMQDNPHSFVLPETFMLDGVIMADIFQNGALVANGISDNIFINKDHEKYLKNTENYLSKDKSNQDYFLEADYYIKKAKQLYGEEQQKENKNSPTFFDGIKEDFDLLFSMGNEDYLLCKKFKNSRWKKVDISGEVYILGKIYAGGVTTEETPSFIALAMPTTFEQSLRTKPLGGNAKFYHANIYDNFGFVVLVENTISGKVVNL